MITHIWSVLCERAIIDKESNNVTFTVMEQVKVVIEKPPKNSLQKLVLPIKGQVISMWLQDKNNTVPTLEFRVRIKNPKGKVIGQASQTAPFVSSPRLRTITSFNGLPISPKANGNYWFLIEYKIKDKWKTVAKVPYWVEVELIEKPSSLPS